MSTSAPHQIESGPLFLEDLSVGQRFVSGTYELTADEIMAFAAKYDPQPFHLDEEAARTTFFGGLAASGWHTAAITMRLMVGSGIRIEGGLIGAGVEMSWPRPTRPGDVLQVETEILELVPLRSRPDRGIAIVRNVTRNQKGEIVQDLKARMIVPRRVTPGAEGVERDRN